MAAAAKLATASKESFMMMNDGKGFIAGEKLSCYMKMDC